MVCKKTSAPIDRGWAWMVVIGVFFNAFLMTGILKSFGILLDELVWHFNIPVALGATVMAVVASVFTVVAPISVTAGQHFGQRRVVVLGGLVGGIGLCLSGLLLSIEWVIITFGVFVGIGNGCMYGNGLVMLGLYFREKQGVASGLALSGGGIGLFVLPPLLQLLLDTYGLQGCLVIVGGLYFNTIACGMLYRPLSFYKNSDKNSSSEHDKLMVYERNTLAIDRTNENKSIDTDENKIDSHRYYTSTDWNSSSHIQEAKHDENRDADMYENEQEDSVKETSFKTLGGSSEKHNYVPRTQKFKEFVISIIDISILKSYTVSTFVIVDCLIFCGSFNFALFMPAAAFTRGIDKYQKALLVSINGLCDIVGRLSMGVISDRNILKKYQLMALTAFVCGLAVFCFSFAERFWTLSIFSALYGFCNGGNVTLLVPTVVELFGSSGMV